MKEKIKLVLLAVLTSFCLLASSNAIAQFSISERTYKKLNKVEKLMEKKDFKEARLALQALESSSSGRKYELTLIYQAQGYLYYESSEYAKATEYFEKSLALNSAPEPVLQNIRLNLIQLHAATNNFGEAAQYFEAWLKKETSPSGNILALGGSIYAHTKQYDTAIRYLQQAIASVKQPEESWYRTLLSIYYERKNYQAAATLLEKLVATYPENKQYWTQLFSAYYLLKNYQKALSVLELAYLDNKLENSEEITNLAKLYLYVGAPLKAASLLEKEIKRGQLKENEQSLSLLANSYFQSQDSEKSAGTYQKLAKITDDSEIYLKAAQLYLNGMHWRRALEVLDEIEDKKETGQIQLMRGMALVELKDFDKATQAFREAKKQASTSVNANQWLKFLDAQNQLK